MLFVGLIAGLIGGGLVGYRIGVQHGLNLKPSFMQSTQVPEQVIVYQCDDGKNINAAFSKDQVQVTLSDSRVYTLVQVVAASGIRYADEGETIVFATKGDEGFLLENNEQTYRNCTTRSESEPEGVACTLDAKICSDGSSVGRSGPQCEFDPCPGE